MAQSDNLIVIYKLGPNWNDAKTISNKFELNAKPKCMTWSKTKTKDLFYGTAEGKIKVCLIGKNTSYFLYMHKSPCISISCSLDGKYLISGHKDTTILLYNIETSIPKILFKHSCPPLCLTWGIDSNILIAGNDYKVVIYTNNGKIIQNFDYSNDDDDNIKEFGCCSINQTGDVITLGNSDSFYIYFYNQTNKKWDELITKVENYIITSICLKPDNSALVIGNFMNNVDMYKINNNENENKNNFIKDNMYEIEIINDNNINITNKQNGKSINIMSQYSSPIQSHEIYLDNFLVIFKNKSLILMDFKQEKYSEISWTKTGSEKFDFNSPYICIICDSEGLALVEFGMNEILFYEPTKKYTNEDINKIKLRYYNYLIMSEEKEKASLFKESINNLNTLIDSYIKQGDFINAANLVIKNYKVNLEF